MYNVSHSLGLAAVLNRFVGYWRLRLCIDTWSSFGETITNSTPVLSWARGEKRSPTARRKQRGGTTFLIALSICALCPVNVPTREAERGGGVSSMSDSGEERRGREHVPEGQGKTVSLGESWKETALFPSHGCYVLFGTALHQSWGEAAVAFRTVGRQAASRSRRMEHHNGLIVGRAKWRRSVWELSLWGLDQVTTCWHQDQHWCLWMPHTPWGASCYCQGRQRVGVWILQRGPSSEDVHPDPGGAHVVCSHGGDS